MSDRNGKGQFVNGNSGRKKGSKNRPNKIRDWALDYLSDSENQKRLTEEISKLKGKEYAETLIKLFEFAIPKLQRQTVKLESNQIEVNVPARKPATNGQQHSN